MTEILLKVTLILTQKILYDLKTLVFIAEISRETRIIKEHDGFNGMF